MVLAIIPQHQVCLQSEPVHRLHKKEKCFIRKITYLLILLLQKSPLLLKSFFVGGKLACWYFYFQLLVVVSAGFGESTFSYGTGGKLLGLNADRSKGLAVVECFFANGRNFGANLYSP